LSNADKKETQASRAEDTNGFTSALSEKVAAITGLQTRLEAWLPLANRCQADANAPRPSTISRSTSPASLVHRRLAQRRRAVSQRVSESRNLENLRRRGQHRYEARRARRRRRPGDDRYGRRLAQQRPRLPCANYGPDSASAACQDTG
jgi:hypothetical protein